MISLSKIDTEKLDAILQNLILKPNFQFRPEYLTEIINTPISKTEYYCQIISSFQPEIVLTFKSGSRILCLVANEYTQEFLEQEGGFSAIYAREKEKKDKEEKDRELQRINWKTTTETSKEAVKLSKWSIWLSVGAIIISLITLIFK